MYVDPDNCRKAFHFDLDYHKLCEEFGPKNTSAAYHKIKAFMTSHGFEKAQYSGYVSVAPMKDTEFYRIYNNLKTHFPWFERCAQKAHVSIILETYDLLQYANQQTEPDLNPTFHKRESLQYMQERKAEEAAHQNLSNLPTHIDPSQER